MRRPAHCTAATALGSFAGDLRAGLALCAALLVAAPLAPAAAQVVVQLDVEGGIGAATSEYLASGIEHAEDTGAELVLIRMDTPGGLMGATREIVSKILNSGTPVVTYVHPAGARADSAGTFILLASHIAAMTPTTVVGAATPVSITGDDIAPSAPKDTRPADKDEDESGDEATDEATREGAPETAMGRKVLNDSVSYIRGLAARHGRNADWAERAVREAATLSAEDALAQNVIDLIAADRDDLLQAIDGREVTIGAATVTLATAEASIEPFEPTWRIKLLSVIQQPEIILLLGMIGIYGLLLEGYNPGAMVPGVVGAISLLLALYALQVLPINYAGLALILLGIGLMVAEAYAPSFGALGLGGVVAFAFGAIMMFDTGVPGFGISISFVVALSVIFAGLLAWTLTYVMKLRRRGAVSGGEAIVGRHATATKNFIGDGEVWLEGEAWAAYSKVAIVKDQQVVVVARNGLRLEVEPALITQTPVAPAGGDREIL